MEGYHNGNSLELIPSAANGAHLARWVMAEETRHCGVAESDDDLRLDNFDQGFEIGQAETHFVERGWTVAVGLIVLRAPLQNIGGEDVLAREPHRASDFGQ